MSKKKLKKQFRSFELSTPEDAEYVVEGYAAVFNQTVPLFEHNGKTFCEVILPGAFDGADMSNVIMYYGHGGKPVALTSNDTLRLSVDEHGLKFWAYLGGTEEGRNLWEEVKGGYITKMSFCFDMAEECDSFDGENTRRVTAITAVYDVSAVDCPAYDGTEVHARSADDSVKNKIREKLKNKNKNTKRSSEKMTLAQIIARLAEIASRRTAIEAMLDAENPTFTDIDGNPVTEEDILTELDSLDEEEEQLEADKAALEAEGGSGDDGPDDDGANKRNVLTRRGVKRNAAGNGGTHQRVSSSFTKERRTSIANHELRSLLASSGKIASPTKTSSKIADAPRAVSSIIDQVFVEDLTGTGGIELPFARDVLEADEVTEGEARTEKDSDVGVALVKSTDISVLTSISRKYAKLSPHRYEEKVRELAWLGLKKKLAKLIVHGSNDGNMYGVYNAVDKDGKAMCGSVKLSGNIDHTTLRKIVFGHGSDEEVDVNCRLYLNKKDLTAFGDVRGKNELRAIYEIIPEGGNPNVGVIKDGGLSVPYTVCSRATAFTEAEGTAEGAPTMFYGDPETYTLGVYGDYEIRVSEDFQFNKGLNTIAGDATVGGNLNTYKGFTVVKKVTA